MHAVVSFILFVFGYGSPCTIHTIMCAKRQDLVGKSFADEPHVQTEHICYRRANSFNLWCENEPNDSITVTATFNISGKTQFFSPNACPVGWVLFNDACYFYNTEYMNWTSANNFCAVNSAALVSIHSPLENDFLYSLTGGVSTWIGFRDTRTEVSAVEDYKWTDNSPVEYRNWNTSHPADSDKGKEWHEWDSRDPAPFICKKASLNELVGIRSTREIPTSIPQIVSESTTLTLTDILMAFLYILVRAILSFGSL